MSSSSRAVRRLRKAQRLTLSINQIADVENRKWPEALVQIDIPEDALTAQMSHPPVRAWRSRHFLVQQFLDAGDDGDTYVRLSVQRCKHAAFRTDAVEDPISWDALMRCKAQCGYGDAWAVEVFPPDDEVVNRARMRHLFIVDPARLPFRWTSERSGRSGLSAATLLEPADG